MNYEDINQFISLKSRSKKRNFITLGAIKVIF